MPTLQDIADASRPTAETTAGWVMQPQPSTSEVLVRVRHPDWIKQHALELGLPEGTKGVTLFQQDGIPVPIIYVPPLNTVEDMEVWRHELRHALEGRAHGHVEGSTA